MTDETRSSWEDYADMNRDWLYPSFTNEMKLQAIQDAKFGLQKEDMLAPSAAAAPDDSNATATAAPPQMPPYSRSVFGFTGPEPAGSGPYLINWQFSPVLPIMSFLNFNILPHPATNLSFQAALNSGKMI